MHQDDHFRDIQPGEIKDLVKRVKDDLDALVVLLMFSVFEATVRQRILDEMTKELAEPPRQRILKKAVDDARDAVQHGSFGRLTESYKSLDPDAKTLVDQVRQYRNWVAHGRRSSPTNNVDPQSALTRLERFLGLLDDNSVVAEPIMPSSEMQSGGATPGYRPA